jgi:hypothetical protein
MLQQAVYMLPADPSLAFPNAPPVQCQMMHLPQPMQAATAAGPGGLMIAASCTPASWDSSCSSSAATCFVAPESAYNCSQLHCVLGPISSIGAADALPAVYNQQQQVLQLLLPEPTFGAKPASGVGCFSGSDMHVVSSSWPAGLYGHAFPQVLLTQQLQPAPGWHNTTAAWQQLF